MATRGEEPGRPDMTFIIWTKVFDLLRLLVKYGAYVYIAYWGYRSVEALAGKITLADLALSYFTSKENDHGIPWVIAVLCGIWAIAERRFRLAKTQSMSDYIKDLEKRLDPNRTSSDLLPTGETNPRHRTL
jgi:hypothetical protein